MRMMALFGRDGDARFLGHLDMQRAVQRALRRSGLPVSYSQGFSPHMLLTFAAAMPVGLRTRGDILEVAVERPCEDFAETLRPVMPEGLTILGARQMAPDEGKTMATLSACRYRVFVPGQRLEEAAEALWAKETLVMPRRTKSGVKDTDIRPMVHSLRAADREGGAELWMTVRHDNAVSLRPELVVRALLGEAVSDEDEWEITRLSMYRQDEAGRRIELYSREPEN